MCALNIISWLLFLDSWGFEAIISVYLLTDLDWIVNKCLGGSLNKTV